MKDDFKLENVGKQLPYQVPAGFFEEITAQTLQEAKRRSDRPVVHVISSWKVWVAAASVAVLLVCAYFLSIRPEHTPAKMAVTTKPDHVEEPNSPAQVSPAISPAPSGRAESRLGGQEQKVAVKKRRLKKEPESVAPTPVVSEKEETLEELLASISDEELQQIAAQAETEEYVYGDTFE